MRYTKLFAITLALAIALSLIGCDKGNENIQESSSTTQTTTTTKPAPKEWTSNEDADQMAYYIYMLASGISLDAKNREISVSEDLYKHDDGSDFVAAILISLDEFEADIICPADLTFEITMGANSPMSVKCEGMGFSGEYPVSE